MASSASVANFSGDSTVDFLLATAKDVFDSLAYEILLVTITLIAVALSGSLRERVNHSPQKFAPKAVDHALLPHASRKDADESPFAQPRRNPSTAAASKASAGMQLHAYADAVISTRLPTSKALSQYREIRKAGNHVNLDTDLAAARSKHRAVDLFTALVQCAGRAGLPDAIEQLFDDMVNAGVERPIQLYESAMRLLAGKKFFDKAIAVYDRMAKDGHQPSGTTLSCLVGFTCEIGDCDRATLFFEQLCVRELPSLRACMAMLRLHSKHNDWTLSLKLLADIKALGVKLDSIVLNITLSTGISVGEVGAVERMLGEEIGMEVADVVSYNIVMKGLAQAGKVDRTMKLLYSMAERGVEPNLITFNTAIDAAVRARKSDDAWRFYDLMVKESKMRPDKCTASTLVKTLYQERCETVERLEMLSKLIDDVFADCNVKLQESLCVGCMDAALRLPSAGIAMRRFEKLYKSGFAVSSTDKRRMAVAAANAADEEGCRMVWVQASRDGDMEDLRKIVNRHVQDGRTFIEATMLMDSAAVAEVSAPSHGRRLARRDGPRGTGAFCSTPQAESSARAALSEALLGMVS